MKLLWRLKASVIIIDITLQANTSYIRKRRQTFNEYLVAKEDSKGIMKGNSKLLPQNISQEINFQRNEFDETLDSQHRKSL